MSVRALRRGSIAAARVVGTPTTYTIYSNVADGYQSGTAPADACTTTVTNSDIYIGGQVGSYYQGYLSFDTSAVVGTITAVTLSLYGMNDSSVTDFTLEARLHDWGVALALADWVAGASQGALPLLASKSTAGWNAAGYNVLTSDAAFLSNIDKTGFTRLVLSSSRHRTGVNPGGNEYVGIKSGDASGTSTDPKLVIDALV